MTLVEPTGDDIAWVARCPCGGDAWWRAKRVVVIEQGYSYQRVDYNIDCDCDEMEKAA